MLNFGVLSALALTLCSAYSTWAADLTPPVISSAAPAPVALYDPTKFELRGGIFVSPLGPEEGTFDVSPALVFPKFGNFEGWQDLLVPRLRIGAVANLGGRTSYAYADGLWTVNFDKIFVEAFFGGLIHDGPLVTEIPGGGGTALGCRELYHMGADLGYRFDAHWSLIATFEHGSNGTGWASNCRENRGLNVTGLAVGYSF